MKKALLVLALVATAPMAAFAADGSPDLNYNYLEGGYANVDGDADGAYLRGSVELGQSNFYLTGEYARVELDNTNFDVDFGEIGLGYRHALGAKTDLLGEVAYNRIDTDFGDLDGYRASVGVRHAFAPRFNGLAKVNYRDYDGTNGDYSLTVGGEFKFNQNWALAGEVEVGEHDAEQYRLGVRYNF